MDNNQKKNPLSKNKPFTAYLNLSSALNEFDRLPQVTEDGVKGATLPVKGVDDSVRKELDEILKR
jgi:hypothetical protein